MSSRTDELARELRRLKPESSALRSFRCPDLWHLADHFTASSCPTCTAHWEPGPPTRGPTIVREIKREDRERAAFRRLSHAIAALINRGECDS